MKNQRGVTLGSLAVYLCVFFIALTILIRVIANFRTSINEMNAEAENVSDYNKFNLVFLQDVKEIGNKVESIEETKIVFTNGNTYEFNITDSNIYLKSANNIEDPTDDKTIRILGDVTSCEFTKKEQTEEKVIIEIIMTIGDEQKTSSYVMNYQNQYSNY